MDLNFYDDANIRDQRHETKLESNNNKSQAKLCITGTSGAIGSSVLRHLLDTLHYPPSNLIISSSNPSSIPVSITSKGVIVRYGNYLDPSTLATAFIGATKLLIVSFPSMEDESRFAAHRNAIDAAKAAGVQHLYYTSLAFNGQPTQSPVMFAHGKTEQYLKEKDMTYTILREGLYNEHFPLYCGFFDPQKVVANIAGAREVVTTTVGGVAYAAIDDLGEATARIVAHSGPEYDNRMCLLSGPVAVRPAELAAMISTVLSLDPPLVIKLVDASTFFDHNVAQGRQYLYGIDPATFLKGSIETGKAITNGEASVTGTLLEEVLGRKPKDAETTIREILSGVK